MSVPRKTDDLMTAEQFIASSDEQPGDTRLNPPGLVLDLSTLFARLD